MKPQNCPWSPHCLNSNLLDWNSIEFWNDPSSSSLRPCGVNIHSLSVCFMLLTFTWFNFMKISKQAFLSILRFFLSCPLNLKATKQFFTCSKVRFWRVQTHINMRMMCLPDQAMVQSLVRIDQWSVYYPGWRKKRLDVKFKKISLITFITNKIVTVATTRGSSKIFTVSLVLRNNALCKPLGWLQPLVCILMSKLNSTAYSLKISSCWITSACLMRVVL